MAFHPFLNAQRRLRSGWWIAIFFVVLTALLFPVLLTSREQGGDVSIYLQAAIVLAASLICQALRRKPISDLIGPLDGRWPLHMLVGMALGAALMAIPALALGLIGAASWRFDPTALATFAPTLAVLAAAAAAEELLFRGFLFQRFIDGLGAWPAQIIIAALFVLTHSDALNADGAFNTLAAANIFLASIVFGLAYLRTRSLALPFGLHFAANAMQGPVLGFGVSGGDQTGLLAPSFHDAPDWLDGGAFGLEASLPGLICVIALLALLWRWRGTLRNPA
jgi:membrane protease YdiL (CAAX protease family)